jgi:gliding motility-associated-like protein
MRRLLLLLSLPILAEAQPINRVEYFWDTDPGPGNGTALVFAPATSLTLSPTIPLTSVAEGLHILYFRSRSAGKWSLPLARAVWVQRGAQIASASFITHLEYFIDTDPGRGNGVNVPIASAANINRNFAMLLGTVPEGFHVVYFRARDVNGQWSLPLARPVYVQRNAQTATAPALRRLEYFIDTDPGPGNGTTVPLTSSVENQSIIIDLSTVSPGFHILHLRAEDSNGRWSMVKSKPFLAEYSGSDIVAVDYFFTDGTTTSATHTFTGFTPGPDLTLNFAAALTGLNAGAPYNIHMVGRNARGQYTAAAIHAFTTPAVLCDPLSAPVATSNDGCPGTITLQASGAASGQSYLWYDAPTGGTPLPGATTGSFTTPPLVASTTYYAVILNGTCESARTAVTATILNCSQPPQFTSIAATTPAGSTLIIPLFPLLSDPDNNLDTASIQVIVPPVSQATTSIVNGVLTINYDGINFAGADYLTLEVCDLTGACVQQVIYIDVVGDVVVYNALSPNGDGKNDTFIIQHLELFPQTRDNKLTIYNRWGTVVFEAANYDNTNNVFRGLSNSDAELPTGTYYYVLEFSSGAAKRTGFISLRR